METESSIPLYRAGPPDSSTLDRFGGRRWLLNSDWLSEWEDRPLFLDVGMGMGRFLMSEAEKRSDVRFIGVDSSYQCLKRNLIKLENRRKRGILFDHVRVFYGSVYHLLNEIPNDVVDRVYINYPDPWFKRKHLKRRLVRLELFQALGRVLKTGACVYVQTDIKDYHLMMQDEFARLQEYEWQNNAESRFEGLSKTLYQEKAEAKQLPRFMHYFQYLGTP